MIHHLCISTSGQGLYSFTEKLHACVPKDAHSGLCTLFIQHTSASLLIQENYDRTAQEDLENWINRLVPERDPHYTHTLEGDDDMPAHIKSTITATTLSIPIENGRLVLGTWQGVYLWEHRHGQHARNVVVHIAKD